MTPERPIPLTVRWAGRQVRLMSHDGGNTYLGPTGEKDLLLVLLPVSTGGWLARIEDRLEGLSWSGEVKLMPDVAFATLQRQIKRLARACHVKVGGV